MEPPSKDNWSLNKDIRNNHADSSENNVIGTDIIVMYSYLLPSREFYIFAFVKYTISMFGLKVHFEKKIFMKLLYHVLMTYLR